ncbi:hypothetical protein ACIRUY_01395 [Streptomyces erythrochromogenes]
MISLLCVILASVAMAVLIGVGLVVNHRDAVNDEPEEEVRP